MQLTSHVTVLHTSTLQNYVDCILEPIDLSHTRARQAELAKPAPCASTHSVTYSFKGTSHSRKWIFNFMTAHHLMIAAQEHFLHRVSKSHPFYFCDIFVVRFRSILLIFGRNIPQEIWNKNTRTAQLISRFMFVPYLVKPSNALERTLRRLPLLLPIRLVIVMESHNFFRSLFKPFTFEPLSENSWINFLPPKTLNLCNFSIKMLHFIGAW